MTNQIISQMPTPHDNPDDNACSQMTTKLPAQKQPRHDAGGSIKMTTQIKIQVPNQVATPDNNFDDNPNNKADDDPFEKSGYNPDDNP
jgi:hypothetical protein